MVVVKDRTVLHIMRPPQAFESTKTYIFVAYGCFITSEPSLNGVSTNMIQPIHGQACWLIGI